MILVIPPHPTPIQSARPHVPASIEHNAAHRGQGLYASTAEDRGNVGSPDQERDGHAGCIVPDDIPGGVSAGMDAWREGAGQADRKQQRAVSVLATTY